MFSLENSRDTHRVFGPRGYRRLCWVLSWPPLRLSLLRAIRMTGPDGLHELQQEFFDTTFVMMGYIAKADGRVSETEIAQAEALFTQFRLTPSQRENAIKRFKRGAETSFDRS